MVVCSPSIWNPIFKNSKINIYSYMISNMTSCCSWWKSMLYVVMLYVCNVVSMYKTILCEDKRSHAKFPYWALTRLSIVSHDLRAAALPPRRVKWSSQPCKGWSCSDCSPRLNFHNHDSSASLWKLTHMWGMMSSSFTDCMLYIYCFYAFFDNTYCQNTISMLVKIPLKWPHNNKLKWFYCLSIRWLQYRYMLHTCNS